MKKRFTLLLNEEVVKEAKKIAIDEGMNFSTFVERLLIYNIKLKETENQNTQNLE